MWRFLRRLVWGALIGTALAAAIMITPLPEAWWRLQTALGALVFVCAIGKALYDTLFYDRYWP